MDITAQHPAALVLGTAQLGMAYGIANRTGTPSHVEAMALVRRALALGISCFDTARAYGESEARLGESLAQGCARIVTKIPPLDELAADAPATLVIEAVRRNIAKSSAALRHDRLDTVLLHRASHLRSHNGLVWDTLLTLCEEGRIGRLGVSVQSPAELRLALSFRAVSHIQLPLNVLDWRWRDSTVHGLFEIRPDVIVHARSIFLQGLLLADNAAPWPAMSALDCSGLITALSALAETLGRDDTADLCIAYARAMPYLQGIVVGAETISQLDRNAALAAKAPLDPDECAFVERFLPRVPETLLNPAQWPKRDAA